MGSQVLRERIAQHVARVGMGLKLLDAICEHWYAESGRVVASLTI